MKNHDEEAKKRREQRHKEMRAGFIKNLNALMYERNYSCQQLSTNIQVQGFERANLCTKIF